VGWLAIASQIFLQNSGFIQFLESNCRKITKHYDKTGHQAGRGTIRAGGRQHA
jgi:hypothetical protein